MIRILFFILTTCLPLSAIEKVVILGGGPAGLMAGVFAGQAVLNPLIVEGCPEEGQYSGVYKIENFPGFPEGISGEELNCRLKEQAARFGANFCPECAVSVDLENYPFRIELSDGTTIETESLILATGASPKWLGIEGEQELIGKGIGANALREAKNYVGKDVIVVGGGDSAMEQALILAEYAKKVFLIYKGSSFYAAKYLQERVLNNSKIEALFNQEVIALTNTQAVEGVILQNSLTLPCEGIFVANGRKPNTDLFMGQLEMNASGYIVTKPGTTQTSCPGVFVAGDIADLAYRKMVTAAASGCMSAIDAIKFLKEKVDRRAVQK